jgi:mono/diheme cytochrome c family protein
MIAALASTSAAYVIFLLILVGWIVYYFMNRRAARPELGSEALTAPNRKPYYDDEMLEGKRLERFQFFGVVMLAVLVIAMPLYWVLEPDREAGATAHVNQRFVNWGEQLFQTTANGGFNCAGCHGGLKATGGNAPYAVTDPKTGEVKSVSWFAPALNTVTYRFDDSEITYILTYGRVGSPMSAWGVDGGGPMNAQQIQTLISYLHSIQIPRVDCLPSEKDPLTCPSGHLPPDQQADIAAAAKQAAQALVDSGKYKTVDDAMGEALFNLNLNSGAYSCARCHTPGWSYGDPGVPGSGAYGWNLTGGAVNAHFDSEQDMIDAIKAGSELGKRFGAPTGQGTGRMPAFGNLLTDAQIKQIVEYVRGL